MDSNFEVTRYGDSWVVREKETMEAIKYFFIKDYEDSNEAFYEACILMHQYNDEASLKEETRNKKIKHNVKSSLSKQNINF